VAGFKSERWPASGWNAWPDCAGICTVTDSCEPLVGFAGPGRPKWPNSAETVYEASLNRFRGQSKVISVCGAARGVGVLNRAALEMRS
jgi:hypothetical protein